METTFRVERRMVDPNDITKFDRSDDELIEFLIFGLSVQGKTASTQARLLDRFIFSLPSRSKSLRYRIHRAIQLDRLGEYLRESRLGQYNRLEAAITAILALDLKTCTCEDLESIPGIGPKTARFFLMHTRPNQRVAALDTHILKLLAERGVEKVPAITPSKGANYRRLEEEFLKLADKAKMTPADYDLFVWKSYANKERLRAA